jgi:alkylated DNA repair dioxygenase AlkB
MSQVNVNDDCCLIISLSAGDLLLICGRLQHNWQHQLPKIQWSVGKRINLTFRLVVGQMLV